MSEAEVHQILQSHQEGVSLRGISRITDRSEGTVTQILQHTSERAQMVHNQEVSQIASESVAADEFWSFVKKKQAQVLPHEVECGDCWTGLSLDRLTGLILTGRVGKHTDALANQLIMNTQGKTDCWIWYTDGWEAYERQLGEEMTLWVGKSGTQRLERTNGILRQQNGRWHRRQNKFSKLWTATQRTVRLAITYFNWIWQNSWTQDTAAQRAGLALTAWSWWDITNYPTLL